MKSILKLMRAHIRYGKDAFFGILLLMSLITFSFSGTVSNDDVLRNELEKNFAEENVGDLVIMMYDDNLTEDMLSSLDSNTKVAGYSVKNLMYLKSYNSMIYMPKRPSTYSMTAATVSLRTMNLNKVRSYFRTS